MNFMSISFNLVCECGLISNDRRRQFQFVRREAMPPHGQSSYHQNDRGARQRGLDSDSQGHFETVFSISEPISLGLLWGFSL